MPKPKTDVVFSNQYPKLLAELLEMAIENIERINGRADICILLDEAIDELKYINKNCIY